MKGGGNLNVCPHCQVEWTVCDEDCCGGTIYCPMCGVEKSEIEGAEKR